MYRIKKRLASFSSNKEKERKDEKMTTDGDNKNKGNSRSKNNMTNVSEKDYLTEDPPVRGQNYACVSFLCPEEILRDKNAFVLQRFMKAIGDDLEGLFSSLEAKFGSDPDVTESLMSIRERHAYIWKEEGMKEQMEFYKSTKGEELERQFDESNEFETSTRGIKIRGVYDTYDQAINRSKLLHDMDKKKGNVFVCQVGCWCPWNPDPNAIQDNEYAVNELNTLMKKNEENMSKKDELYEERKHQRKQAMLQQNEKNKQQYGGGESSTSSSSQQQDRQEDVDDDGKIAYDTWLKSRRAASSVVEKQKREKKDMKKQQRKSKADGASRSTDQHDIQSAATTSGADASGSIPEMVLGEDVWTTRKNEEHSSSAASLNVDVDALKQTAAAVKEDDTRGIDKY